MSQQFFGKNEENKETKIDSGKRNGVKHSTNERKAISNISEKVTMYYETPLIENWLPCLVWVHENSEFDDMYSWSCQQNNIFF